MSNEKLKQKYEAICNEYANKFANKQGLTFNGWVGNDVGGVGLFSDLFFNFKDITWDINYNCESGLIIKWRDDCIQNPIKSVSYYAYSKGLRFTDL